MHLSMKEREQNVFMLCDDKETNRKIAEGMLRRLLDRQRDFAASTQKGGKSVRFIKKRGIPAAENGRRFTCVTMLSGGMAAAYVLGVRRRRRDDDNV